MAVRVHSAQRITGQLQEKFKPIVIDAIKSYINDRINERLNTAMEAEKLIDDTPVADAETSEETENTFTEEEREGLYIVRAICASDVNPSRLSERDTKSYCSVIVDNNSRKYFVRMYFNGSSKKIEVFDNIDPSVIAIESLSDIYTYSERIKSALQIKLA